jgi:hypothetical protein
MDLNQYITELKNSGLESAESFLYSFLKIEDEFIDIINNINTIKSEIYLKDVREHDQHVKLASMFSDLTSLYIGSSRVNNMHISFFNEESPYSYSRDVTIPPTLTNEILNSKALRPGYMYNSNEDVKYLFNQFEPLLDMQKIVIRPTRILWADNSNVTGFNGSMIYYADGNTSTRRWIIRDKYYDENAIPIEFNTSSIAVHKLFEITLPFFKGASIETFSKVLKDENDLLSSFRTELKQLLKAALNGETTVNEILNDILIPRVDTINRKFKEIKNLHKLSIGRDISFFAVSLIVINNIPGVNVQELIQALIGGGGVITKLLHSEINHQKEINRLKDDPLFLLWQIKRLS